MYNPCSKPEWFEANKINEPAFAECFIREHPLIYVNGLFFDFNGKLNRNEIESEIHSMIAGYITTDYAAKIKKLVNAIAVVARVNEMPVDCNVIHFINGDYDISNDCFICFDESTVGINDICANRLKVKYNPEAGVPGIWLKFLEGLLMPTDILTLQEFMGYCLIPTNIAQKMLMIIGEGGEGKSRIGNVLKDILGDSMCNMPLQKLASDRFARADLEGMLAMVDDDMNPSALKDTNIIKSLATLEGCIDLERKGSQSVQGHLYSRMIAFSNGDLQALYDKSEGFYRRQIVLSVLPKPEDRIDDPYLSQKLKGETEGIVLWCIEGLKRLIANDYRFTISEKTKDNLEEARKSADNTIEFYSSAFLQFDDPNACEKSCNILNAYKKWCEWNGVSPVSDESFRKRFSNMVKHDRKHNVKKIKLCHNTANGYMGIYVRNSQALNEIFNAPRDGME